MDIKEFIARRVARELKDGDVVNLGIGLPTLVANYLPEDVNVLLQSENGFIGLSSEATEENFDKDIVNAGANPVTVIDGAVFFDSATSFGIIRGGHVDATILGALEVDSEGNLANYMVPGKTVPGMGGAMDLVSGARRVIIAMQHTAKGRHKILEKCTLPLTAKKQVNMIITEMAVMNVTDEGIVLSEIAEGLTTADVQAATGAKLIISENLKTISV